jgi:hypothetical protein
MLVIFGVGLVVAGTMALLGKRYSLRVLGSFMVVGLCVHLVK